MTESSNKRKYPRVEGKGVAAYLRLNGHNAGCTVHNISVGGIFVKTDRFLPVGTKLAFDLIKPGMKKAITVSGWVVGVITAELAARTKLPQGLRIQFGKLTPNANDALQELVGSLRRSPDAQPPVLYTLETKSRRGTGSTTASRRASRPPTASGLTSPPVLKPSRPMAAKALGDDPPNSTEVDVDARPGGVPVDQGKEDPSIVRKWFEKGEAGEPPGPAVEDAEDAEDDLPSDRGGSGEQPMIDDSLLDSAGDLLPSIGDSGDEAEPELEQPEKEALQDGPPTDEEGPEQEQEESGEPEEEREEAEADELAARGPNPFDDDDKTIGEEPTRAKARYGGGITIGAGAGAGESSKRPTAPRPPPARARSTSRKEEDGEKRTPGSDGAPGGGSALEELEGANRELQRLLERREGEIATLRAQVTKLEQSLKDREEQLQLAKRVLRTNGLG
ncbi:MAG TPA: PilZ domain-containing protein [Myxococcales bacterium]|nr:PilZ domain-containing protein [Myxococcales bacterium]